MWRLITGWTLGLVFLAGMLHAQQWERLPLNIGYLDKLVQNPYNPMEIVGYIQNGNFYRSTDGGLSWGEVQKDSVPFVRSYHRLRMDSIGRYYLMTHTDGLWRSDDRGITWTKLSVPGETGYSSSSSMAFGSKGEIFIWASRAQTLYTSRDDGVTWSDLGPQGLKVALDFYLDSRNNALMLVLAQNQIVVTTDHGSTWIPYPLPAAARSFLFPQARNGSTVFRYFSGTDISEVYESCDTGRTWQQVTRQLVQVTKGNCLIDIFITEKHFLMNDSTEIYPICHTLQRSTDSGHTFQQITDFPVEDVVQVGTNLIASVPLRGLIRSTDYGDTWSPVPFPPSLLRVNDFEFAHAHDDTMFVLIGDIETDRRLVVKLLESDDGGMTWDTLFTTGQNYMNGLFVDAGRPSRYYVHASVPDERYGDPNNRLMLLSGIAGQCVPDTILVTTSFPRPTDIYPPETFRCRPSERYPGWIYASRNTNSIGWSSNRGESWEWHEIPITISKVTPWPSQVDPRRMVVTAYEQNPIPSFNWSGLYYTSSGGLSFEWVNRNEGYGDLYASSVSTNGNDQYFLYYPPDSSSLDYGRTWELTHDGLHDGTTHMFNHETHGEIIMQSNTGMYIYQNNRWNLLRDREGTSIWSEAAQTRWGGASFIDYTNRYVYIGVQTHGLFRIELGAITAIRNETVHTPRAPTLELYPNPADTRVSIFWGFRSFSKSIDIQIFDVLGREVWRAGNLSETGSLTWNCRRFDRTPVASGVYLVVLIDGSGTSTTTSLIIR